MSTTFNPFTGKIDFVGLTESAAAATYLTIADAGTTYVPYSGATGAVDLNDVDLTNISDLGVNDNIALADTTTSTEGVITKGGTAFVHNFHHPTGDSAVPVGQNTFIGVGAGNFTMGSTATSTAHASNEVCVGYGAGASITTGQRNCFVGSESGNICSSGQNNNGVGFWALRYLTTGSYNNAMGGNALQNLATGDNNCAVGGSALSQITNGSNNVAIGYAAAQSTNLGANNTSSDNGTYIGTNVQTSSNNAQHEIVIGRNAKGIGDYKVVLGTSSHTGCYLPGDNYPLYIGAGYDASFYYDGTDCNIDTDLVAPSDLVIDCGTAKTLKLEVPVYIDMQFPVSSGKIGAANNPTWTQLTTNTYDYAFGVDDYLDLASNEVPHSWVEGGNAEFHIHFSLTAAQSAGASRYAKFTAYIAYVNTSGTWTETTATAEQEIPDGTAQYFNYYLDLGTVALTDLDIGTQIKVRISRIAATGGTEYASNVYIHQVGAHVQVDTLGSRGESTK